MTDAANTDITKAPITYNTLISLSKTPTVPERYQGRPMDLYAAILIGRELAIGPMESINELYLVDGSISMSAKLMSSLVHRQGHILKTTFTKDSASVEALRRMPDGELESMGTITFTQEDAERAKLWGKGAWKAYPMVMMGWRAVSIACRFYFPDCITAVKYEASEVGIEVGEMPPLPDAVMVADEDDDRADALDAESVAEVLDAEIIEEPDDEGKTV